MLGHSDPRVTKKHYAHVIRKHFPATMHRGLAADKREDWKNEAPGTDKIPGASSRDPSGN